MPSAQTPASKHEWKIYHIGSVAAKLRSSEHICRVIRDVPERRHQETSWGTWDPKPSLIAAETATLSYIPFERQNGVRYLRD